jgi:hypothetical protein
VADQWAGVLYLAPVVVAAIVAWAVTRPGRKKATTAYQSDTESDTEVAPVIPLTRPATTPYDGIERRTGSRRPAPATAHPTLFHAALSSHLSAVSRPARGASSAATAASLAAFQSARLVSSRRPTRIPRRPSHQCPRKP